MMNKFTMLVIACLILPICRFLLLSGELMQVGLFPSFGFRVLVTGSGFQFKVSGFGLKVIGFSAVLLFVMYAQTIQRELISNHYEAMVRCMLK